LLFTFTNNANVKEVAEVKLSHVRMTGLLLIGRLFILNITRLRNVEEQSEVTQDSLIGLTTKNEAKVLINCGLTLYILLPSQRLSGFNLDVNYG
jgi:hypothetical protein